MRFRTGIALGVLIVKRLSLIVIVVVPTQGCRDIKRTMGQSESKGDRKLTLDEVSFLFSKKCASQFSAIEIWSIKVGCLICVG